MEISHFLARGAVAFVNSCATLGVERIGNANEVLDVAAVAGAGVHVGVGHGGEAFGILEVWKSWKFRIADHLYQGMIVERGPVFVPFVDTKGVDATWADCCLTRDWNCLQSTSTHIGISRLLQFAEKNQSSLESPGDDGVTTSLTQLAQAPS